MALRGITLWANGPRRSVATMRQEAHALHEKRLFKQVFLSNANVANAANANAAQLSKLSKQSKLS